MNQEEKNKLKTKIKTKTESETKTRTTVGIFIAVLTALVIGLGIYFAAFAPPAGCAEQADGSFKCEFKENFEIGNKIEKKDKQLVIENSKLLLKPNEQIKSPESAEQLSFDSEPPLQLCGEFCYFEGCDDSMNEIKIVNRQDINKNGIPQIGVPIDFNGVKLGDFKDLPYKWNISYLNDSREEVNGAKAMFDSSNPIIALSYSNYFGQNDGPILPLSPGRSEIRMNVCGEKKDSYFITANDVEYDNFKPWDEPKTELDTRFIQGLAVSKNISENLNNKYNINQADIDVDINNIAGLIAEDKMKGSIAVLLSNNNGETWYFPAKYSDDNGQNWQLLDDESLMFGIGIIRDLAGRKLRYEFKKSEGYQLKWAAILQVDDNLMAFSEAHVPEDGAWNMDEFRGEEEDLPGRNDRGNGGADVERNYNIAMTNSQNKPGGVLNNGEVENYIFYDDDRPGGIDFNTNNVMIESLNPEVLTVGNLQNEERHRQAENILPNVEENIVKTELKAIKPGYARIKVTYNKLDEERPRAVKEFAFLVLPKPYINMDAINITYSATKIGGEDVDPDGPGPKEPDEPVVPDPRGGEEVDERISVSPFHIYRGANRMIIKIKPNDDFSKSVLDSAFKAKDLKFSYGKTKKAKLENEVKVYFDVKDGEYYAVLKGLEGGKLDGYNQNGFLDGRMKYYYRFEINDKGIFVNKEKTTTLASFRTLNRRRTILYYYNSIFDRQYKLDKDHNWERVQNGGLNFWYETNITLPGVKFMMLNDRKYEAFNKYLNRKKISNKMVIWLYKKVLDRIYDNDLYKFADENGADYWHRQMKKIRKKDRISREGVKFAISASKEARNELEELFENKNEANAEFSYNVVLKRGGDQDGIKYLVETFGDSEKRMREDLANSWEYNNRLEKINNDLGRKAAIAELYETLYARPADVNGIDYWDKSGKNIWEIKEEFLHSDEFEKVLR